MAAAAKPLSFQKSVLSEEEFKEAIAFRGLTGTTGHSHVPLTDCRPLLVQLWRFALSGAENANVLRPLSNAWRWRWTINPLDSASLLLRRSPFEPRAMACPIASSIRGCMLERRWTRSKSLLAIQDQRFSFTRLARASAVYRTC